MTNEIPADLKKELTEKVLNSLSLEDLSKHINKPTQNVEDKIPDVEHQLTEDEYVRVENVMLHEQMEAMRRELVGREIAAKKNGLQSYFIKKYEVNEETHKIQLDGSKRTVTVLPR